MANKQMIGFFINAFAIAHSSAAAARFAQTVVGDEAILINLIVSIATTV